MKQPELHPGKLVMVQVPVHPLLLKTTKGDGHTLMKKANAHKKGPYHNTISIVFSASLFEVWHDQGPYPKNVRHHINKARHGQLIGDDGLAQRWTRSHPVSSFWSFQAVHNKFNQREWVEAPKDRRSSALKATFQKPQIKHRVFNQLRLVPTSHIACESLRKHMRTPMKWHHSSIGTSSI